MVTSTKADMLIMADEAIAKIADIGLIIGKTITDETEFDTMTAEVMTAIKAIRVIKARINAIVE